MPQTTNNQGNDDSNNWKKIKNLSGVFYNTNTNHTPGPRGKVAVDRQSAAATPQQKPVSAMKAGQKSANKGFVASPKVSPATEPEIAPFKSQQPRTIPRPGPKSKTKVQNVSSPTQPPQAFPKTVPNIVQNGPKTAPRRPITTTNPASQAPAVKQHTNLNCLLIPIKSLFLNLSNNQFFIFR